ncbi:MAG: hypothetical protein AAFS10_19025 [Myxococcota bacterium]
MKTTLALSLMGITMVLSACGGTADIRPNDLQGQITTQQRQRGSDAFAAMLKAHGGLDTWRQFDKVETRFRDEWTNSLFFQFTPYDDNNAQASLEAWLHHFPYSRIAFLEGDGKGEVWIAKGQEVQRLKGGHLQVQSAASDTFFTVFVQNPEMMVGVPFRLASADQVAYAGERTWRGQTYETVLLSWGTFEPQESVDQWLLYINRNTGLLELTEFTVRMSGQSQVGTYHYRDFKEVAGMMLPHRMDAYLSKDDDGPVHIYRFDHLHFSRR